VQNLLDGKDPKGLLHIVRHRCSLLKHIVVRILLRTDTAQPRRGL
jgi:hypothetical protein